MQIGSFKEMGRSTLTNKGLARSKLSGEGTVATLCTGSWGSKDMLKMCESVLGILIRRSDSMGFLTLVCYGEVLTPSKGPKAELQSYLHSIQTAAKSRLQYELRAAPIGGGCSRARTMADFKADTDEHGWPSFRKEEVFSEHVTVDKDRFL